MMNRIRIIIATLLVLAITSPFAAAEDDAWDEQGLLYGGPSIVMRGIDRTGIHQGTITLLRYDSGVQVITVNDVDWEASDTTIYIDGEPADGADLAVGHVVTIVGVLDDDGEAGRAESVTSEAAVEGPVTEVDAGAGVLWVMGQQVGVDETTVIGEEIQPASLDGILPGDVVRVAGYADGAGNVAATRVDRIDVSSEFKVSGSVSDSNDSSGRFRISGLRVDYASARLEHFSQDAPSDGDYVEIRGTLFRPNGDLIADKVIRKNPSTDAVNMAIDLRGRVTNFSSLWDFDVSGFRVGVAPNTEYLDGSTIDLGPYVKVSVQGYVNMAGNVVASEIKVRRSDKMKLEAYVDAVDAESGIITVLGIPVKSDAMTRFTDKSHHDVKDLAVGHIRPGDYLKITGGPDPMDETGLISVSIKRDKPKDNIKLEGLVRGGDEGGFAVFGCRVRVDAESDLKSFRVGDPVAGLINQAFREGDFAKVEARADDVQDGELTAHKAEIKERP